MVMVLGIDAGKAVIRTALIRATYRRFVVEAFGEVSVDEAGSDVEALRRAVGEAKPDSCAIALSGEKTFYRRLGLPAAAQKELDSVLGFELEATVPIEMEDAIFDFRVHKRGQAEEMAVFAALARTDDVRERIDFVHAAIGQEPERVGTGALPLLNLIALTPELEAHTQPYAILDLGEMTSEVLFVHKAEPAFARALSRGTAGLPGTAPALARELRQSVAAFRTLTGESIEALYLSGGGAYAQGAESFLSAELGIPVKALPIPKLDGLTPEQLFEVPRFAKAIGLALGVIGRGQGLNLRKGALEIERRYPFLTEKIPILTALGSVVALSFGFSVLAEMRTLNKERETLLTNLGAASQAVLGEKSEDPEHVRQLLEQGPGSADEDPLPHVDAFDVMVQLSKAVPHETVHDVLELDVSRGHVSIQGVVPSVGDAEAIATKMKEFPCFKDVKVARTSQFANSKQKYVLEFDLKCEDKKKEKRRGSPDGADGASPSPSAGASAEAPQ